jgi:hypothetical protein
MSELTPLLSSTEDDLELLLLRSAEDDEPGAGALPRVAAALGIGAAALGVATTVVMAEQAALGGAAMAKPITLVSVLKWLGVGMTAGALVGGGAHVASRPSHVGALAHPVPAAPTIAAATPAELRDVAPVVVPPPPPVEPEIEEIPEKPAPARGGAASPAAPSPVTAVPPVAGASPHGSTASFESPPPATSADRQASSLSEEVHSLDAARRELAAGHARSALTAIDAYRARFPQGSLRTEATVLRVEALLGSGDRAAAEREANAIVRAAPGSRHAARVLDLLAR